MIRILGERLSRRQFLLKKYTHIFSKVIGKILEQSDHGTIRSFYDTNLSLTHPKAPFIFNDPGEPIYTRPRFLPGSLVENADLNNVLLADGSYIKGAKIQNSIIGLRSQVSENTQISSTILMGADYYDTPSRQTDNGGIAIGVGQGCNIEGAIIDKNVRIGEGVQIKSFPKGTDIDNDLWYVRDGIVVIPKRTVLSDGLRIGPHA